MPRGSGPVVEPLSVGALFDVIKQEWSRLGLSPARKSLKKKQIFLDDGLGWVDYEMAKAAKRRSLILGANLVLPSASMF
jgi:hypothetical protein